MTDPLYPGQRILVEVRFYLFGVPTDPIVARCIVRDPSGSQTVLTYPADEFTRRDLGFFEASVTVDAAGEWRFRGEAAGTVDAVQETSVTVSPSAFS